MSLVPYNRQLDDDDGDFMFDDRRRIPLLIT
jgi:hypothetical protein